MPTITYDKQDLLHLIGKKLSDEQLEEAINSIKPSVEKMGKTEIVIEHTADRPDLFGIEGLARAVRQYLRIDKNARELKAKKSGWKVKCSTVKVRPYIACAVVKNVKLDDLFIKSLMNIQEVLHDSIGKKRRKVAIGMHDLDKIRPPVRYIQAKPGTKMIPLGSDKEMSLADVIKSNPKGKEYGHIISSAESWPLYADAKGIFSFPPIINSERTRVTEKTRRLFVELTGTDKQSVLQTLSIILANLAERGCTIESVDVYYGKRKEATPHLSEDVLELDVSKVNSLLGLELGGREVTGLLEKMGYYSTAGKDKVRVTIPFYRTDILHPVDVIEDIAIAYGYNNFQPKLPQIATVGRPHEMEKLSSKVRNLIAGLGFQEVVTYVLSNEEKQFGRMSSKREDVVEIENPVSSEYSCLRKNLMPGVIGLMASNMHQDYPQKVFEIGDVVLLDGTQETGARNVRKLCCAISDTKVSYEDISSVLDAFARGFGTTYMLKAASHPSFIEGRVAEILAGRKTVGFIGEISPKVLVNWKMEMPIVAFEIIQNQKMVKKSI